MFNYKSREGGFTGTMKKKPLAVCFKQGSTPPDFSSFIDFFLYTGPNLPCSLLWWGSIVKVHVNPNSTSFTYQSRCTLCTHAPVQWMMYMVVQPLTGNRITTGTCPMISTQKHKVQRQAWVFKASRRPPSPMAMLFQKTKAEESLYMCHTWVACGKCCWSAQQWEIWDPQPLAPY